MKKSKKRRTVGVYSMQIVNRCSTCFKGRQLKIIRNLCLEIMYSISWHSDTYFAFGKGNALQKGREILQ